MGKAVMRKISRIVSLYTILFVLLIFFGLSPANGQTGSISGTVSDGTTPIADAQVYAYSFSYPGPPVSDTTDTNGEYTLTGLEAGDYYVMASSPDGQEYVGEWYDDKISTLDATTVPVSADENTADIDFQLEMGGTISGTVSDGTNPIADVMINAYLDACSIPISIFGSGIVLTDEFGAFTIHGMPAGDVYVEADAQGQNYISEWYDDALQCEDADPVAVVAGNDTPNTDFQLETGASISGKVTDSSGTGIAFVQVTAYSDACSPPSGINGSMTDNSGAYTIYGLPTGSVYVKASSYFENYVSEWYDDALQCEDAGSVAVVAGNDTPNIDFQLEAGASISGNVYESDGITPIENASVYALSTPCGGMMMNNILTQTINTGRTDASGAYTITGLPAEGIYVLVMPPMPLFDPNSPPAKPDYIREWYNNGYSCEEATSIALTSGADQGEIDFLLEPSTDSDGDDMPDLWEIYYFGDITTSNGSADSDGDGANDHMEWMDGTAPKDPYEASTTEDIPETTDDEDSDESSSGGTSGGGGDSGCFIATAAYGSLMEPHVKILREFRDNILLNSSIGKAFVRAYYIYSPPIADFIAKRPKLRAITRVSLLPIVGVSWVALRVSPVYSLALIFLIGSGLIGLAGFRRRFRKS